MLLLPMLLLTMAVLLLAPVAAVGEGPLLPFSFATSAFQGSSMKLHCVSRIMVSNPHCEPEIKMACRALHGMAERSGDGQVQHLPTPPRMI